jgi:hypothetical protein
MSNNERAEARETTVRAGAALPGAHYLETAR